MRMPNTLDVLLLLSLLCGTHTLDEQEVTSLLLDLVAVSSDNGLKLVSTLHLECFCCYLLCVLTMSS
jgi:hypothetical protein